MEAVKQEMKDMEVRLREDSDRKLSVIRQDMLKDAQKISSDIFLESKEVNETSKVDETVTEDVINVSNEVDDTNKKLVDNLQNEIAEEQAEEAQIE